MRQSFSNLLLMLTLFSFPCCAGAASKKLAQLTPIDFPLPCSEDGPRHASRAAELHKIVQGDQEDRKNWGSLNADQLREVAKRDVERRMRVGEIFGEGCLLDAPDFAAAALVYQHGDSPDHFYQTFIWARRAVELGDARQKNLMALGLDRFLVKTGRKQLFASQASAEKVGGCYCLDPVEATFPDRLRVEYTGRNLREALKWVASLNSGKDCMPAAECPKPLIKQPRGSIPGFW